MVPRAYETELYSWPQLHITDKAWLRGQLCASHIVRTSQNTVQKPHGFHGSSTRAGHARHTNTLVLTRTPTQKHLTHRRGVPMLARGAANSYTRGHAPTGRQGAQASRVQRCARRGAKPRCATSGGALANTESEWAVGRSPPRKRRTMGPDQQRSANQSLMHTSSRPRHCEERGK